ncbi:putative uncharacterized protein [Eubacterium sp. CAG:274]|nr:putative uncharacterized protein [Eubacterium sp. CAG:274]
MKGFMKSFLVAFLICLLSMTVFADTASSNKLIVNYIDVGQGDSELIECNGQFMLVDAGERDKGTVVVNYLKSRGVEKLDYVIATHPHSDHIGGMSEVLNTFPVSNIIMPKVNNTTATYTNMLKVIQQKGIKAIEPKIGDSYKLGNSTFTIIGPKKYDTKNMNNDSVAFRLVYGNNSFIFCGDAETEEENDIVASGQTLKSDVYKVSHHGSTTSSSSAFLNKVQPKYAVIEVGAGNSYGHPKQKTLEALSKIGATVYRTDLNGSIIITSDGKTLSFGDGSVDNGANSSNDNSTNNSTDANGGGDATPCTSQSVLKNTTGAGSVNGFGTATSTSVPQSVSITYVLNTNTHKIHKPNCRSVSQMKEKNKKTYVGKIADLISQGYSPCKICNPA